tara:strand:+ start:273 stop:662 length:390 start_codon:yes stop_codon:yes gene_type:complete
MLKKLILLFGIILTVIISSCTSQQTTTVSGELDDFAKCLNEKGLKMYGSYTCAICKKQRELFGPSFELVGEIECHPRGENPETERCLKMDIKKTPTWILEEDGVEIKRLDGYQTIETLSELSGCSVQNG